MNDLIDGAKVGRIPENQPYFPGKFQKIGKKIRLLGNYSVPLWRQPSLLQL